MQTVGGTREAGSWVPSFIWNTITRSTTAGYEGIAHRRLTYMSNVSANVAATDFIYLLFFQRYWFEIFIYEFLINTKTFYEGLNNWVKFRLFKIITKHKDGDTLTFFPQMQCQWDIILSTFSCVESSIKFKSVSWLQSHFLSCKIFVD